MRPSAYSFVFIALVVFLLSVSCRRGPAGPFVGSPPVESGSRGTETTWISFADTFIADDQPDENFEGSPLELSTGLLGAGETRILLWFDLTSYACVCWFKSAELRFRDLEGSTLNDSSTVLFNVHRVVEPWDPADVTWNSQPAYDPIPLAQGELIGTSFDLRLPLDPLMMDNLVAGPPSDELGWILIPTGATSPFNLKVLPSVENDGVGIGLDVVRDAAI